MKLMNYNIFTLHPDIFQSFLGNSLIKKAVEKDILNFNLINWRDGYGKGNYKQVDDKPFGGGSGMVLQVEPIFKCMLENKALGFRFEKWAIEKLHNLNIENCYEYSDINRLYIILNKILNDPKFNLSEILQTPYRVMPNNFEFEKYKSKNINKKNITISMTPRGTQFNQKTANYLANNFNEINILCGRYEGFDERVNNMVDLELSIGPFVTNGGEIPAMAVIEGVSRLIPGYVNTSSSALHDSFSLHNNNYKEQEEYIIGKRNMKNSSPSVKTDDKPVFDSQDYIKNILPYIEHPVFTRPSNFKGLQIPDVFLQGHHKKIDQWRKNWFNT